MWRKNPEWISINLGTFLCIQCSGCHRNLGTHISKVRSCQYDRVEPETLKFCKEMGNNAANALWEAFIPTEKKKPIPSDSVSVKQQWIREKYEEMKFIDPTQKKNICQMFDVTQNDKTVTKEEVTTEKKPKHIKKVKSDETVKTYVNPLYGKQVPPHFHFNKVMRELIHKGDTHNNHKQKLHARSKSTLN